jgi:hypothetical protein
LLNLNRAWPRSCAARDDDAAVLQGCRYDPPRDFGGPQQRVKACYPAQGPSDSAGALERGVNSVLIKMPSCSLAPTRQAATGETDRRGPPRWATAKTGQHSAPRSAFPDARSLRVCAANRLRRIVQPGRHSMKNPGHRALAPGTAWGEWGAEELTSVGLSFIPRGLEELSGSGLHLCRTTPYLR